MLAIDTSTQWCSVAIHHDHGGTSVPPFLLIKHEELGALASGVVLDWVAELAQQANIDLLDLRDLAFIDREIDGDTVAFQRGDRGGRRCPVERSA